MDDMGLVYIGKITQLDAIVGADFLVCATVICGKGGKWKGVVRKEQFEVGKMCIVYLPDSIIPVHEEMKFMESSGWRVKMRRFRGAPSEVVIMPIDLDKWSVESIVIGLDVTQAYGVKKYFKPVPANLQGIAKGGFPGFIPKTDEPNYQSVPEMVQALDGLGYYITEKADGSSTTAFRYNGEFGVCSRNWEIMRDENNGYWKVAIKHNLEENLPEGIALQWETCGPKIQSNPMGFKEVTGLAFSAYNIIEKRYLTRLEFIQLCNKLNFPMVRILSAEEIFCSDLVSTMGEGTYENGRQREGVVVRSVTNFYGHKPISFKVINLNYEK